GCSPSTTLFRPPSSGRGRHPVLRDRRLRHPGRQRRHRPRARHDGAGARLHRRARGLPRTAPGWLLMNSDIRWGVPSDGHTFPIYAGPADDMDRIAEFADERGVQHIRFGGDTWRLTADEGPEAQAETATGTWTAKGNSDKFHTADDR